MNKLKKQTPEYNTPNLRKKYIGNLLKIHKNMNFYNSIHILGICVCSTPKILTKQGTFEEIF